MGSGAGEKKKILTSASDFQWSFTSAEDERQWSPMTFEMSGFARPGFWATTLA